MRPDTGQLVSVVIPTYHRPDSLRDAVRSALAQEMPEGWALEVVVGVSDATSEGDRDAAERLSREDARVTFAVASRLGPAAARNAAMGAASGSAIAFIDDDCVAQPDWLLAALGTLERADIVQGRTLPAAPMTGLAHSLEISQLSFLWETCNLVVRRDAVERGGLFDEDWNPTGREGSHYGEDAEWGWRLIGAGATYAFEPAAVVHHATTDLSYGDWVQQVLKIRHLPLVVRECPDVGRRLHRGVFMTRRHVHITAGATLLAAAAVARLGGAHGASRALALAGVVPILSPWRFPARQAIELTHREALVFAALVYGSIRHRRLVL